MKPLDLAGQRFGKLVVKSRTINDTGGHAQWICLCDCGKECLATTSVLNSGKKISCGCMAFHDLTGKRFGMLEVLRRTDNVGEKVAWLCKCNCGQLTASTSANLEGGRSASCGCVRTKHMGKGTRLYRIWSGMKDRCFNEKSKNRKRYGGRGIIVCEEWRKDFDVFRDWAIANGYKRGLSIDRINNDGNYRPDNCRFVTTATNTRNRSTVKLNIKFVKEIKQMLLSEKMGHVQIAQIYGVSRATVGDIANGRIWKDI